MLSIVEADGVLRTLAFGVRNSDRPGVLLARLLLDRPRDPGRDAAAPVERFDLGVSDVEPRAGF